MEYPLAASSHDDELVGEHSPSDDSPAQQEPVQHCPFCGELIGSFWARKDADGRHFCEGCQAFFRVLVD
jgi:hypothetical protein